MKPLISLSLLVVTFFSNTKEFSYDPVGCFLDSSDRDLPFLVDENLGSMTIEKCISSCSRKNKVFAGLQYSIECFCGNSYGKYGKGYCSFKCDGNASQICGDIFANSIFKIQYLKCKSFNLILGDTLQCFIQFYNLNNKEKNYTISIDFGNNQVLDFQNSSNIISFNYSYGSLGTFDLNITEKSLNFTYSTVVNIAGVSFAQCPSVVNQSQKFGLNFLRWNFNKDTNISFSNSDMHILNGYANTLENTIDNPGLYSVMILDDSRIYDKCSSILVISSNPSFKPIVNWTICPNETTMGKTENLMVNFFSDGNFTLLVEDIEKNL
ncbi:WSC domain-containing 2-like, partial [Brachionus plicatilis]